MASLQNIRRRIDSVKSTEKVTKAMKMVSASKLRRAQTAAEAARPYATKMHDMFQGLSIDPDQASHPLLAGREARRALVVVVTPDRGLCGGLNANLNKLAYQRVLALSGDGLEVEVAAVGRKGRDFFRRRGVEIEKYWAGLLGTVTYDSAKEIGGHLVDSYLEERFDRVELVYAHFRSVISQVAECKQLMPITVEEDEAEGDAGVPQSFTFEPSDEEVLGALLPKYIEVQVYQAMLESAASEHGARMTAMDAASRNAKEVIGKLTLVYNRTRQEAVTKELLDIIGGVEALKG
ncbi:MAG: ATP synthase F1 subunit gamma [Leptospirillia bacterium]